MRLSALGEGVRLNSTRFPLVWNLAQADRYSADLQMLQPLPHYHGPSSAAGRRETRPIRSLYPLPGRRTHYSAGKLSPLRLRIRRRLAQAIRPPPAHHIAVTPEARPATRGFVSTALMIAGPTGHHGRAGVPCSLADRAGPGLPRCTVRLPGRVARRCRLARTPLVAGAARSPARWRFLPCQGLAVPLVG